VLPVFLLNMWEQSPRPFSRAAMRISRERGASLIGALRLGWLGGLRRRSRWRSLLLS
jgi:hypothetical protein